MPEFSSRADCSDILTHCADIPAMKQMYIDYYSNNSFDVMCMPTTPATAAPIYSVEPYMLFRGQYLPNRVSTHLSGPDAD